MFDVVIDTLLDALKLLPFLFVTFLILEFFEHKMSDKTQKIIYKAGKFGPVLGGLFGAVPQCGFAAMASSMYTTRVITLGTLISVFLSTSDEMLIIMLSKNDLSVVKQGLFIILIKIFVGIIAGFTVDLLTRNKIENKQRIHDFCEVDNCHCEHGIVRSALHHTLKICLYILIVTFVLNIAIFMLGEENLAKILLKDSLVAPFVSALFGFIPNCASSVIITQMYLAKTISFGSCIAGLLSSSGVGMLILFRVNKPLKHNFSILFIVYAISAFVGFVFDLIGITF